MSDTAPLPVVQPDPGQPGGSGRPGRPGPARRGLRVLDAVAGLLSAGMLVLGLALLVSQLFGAALLGGTGLSAATGPGWWRVAAHLAVGAAGETGVLLRRRLAVGPRAAIAGGTVVAALAVVVAAWWF